MLIHMADNNHFDLKIFLFTMIFLTVSDVSIYNSPSVLLSTVAVLRIQPSVGTKPVVMEVSLQPLRTRLNHLAHQQFAFSSDFSLMSYMLSGFQLLETLKLEYLQIQRDLQLILLMLLEFHCSQQVLENINST